MHNRVLVLLASVIVILTSRLLASPLPNCLSAMESRPILQPYVQYLQNTRSIVRAFDPCGHRPETLSQFILKLEESELSGVPPSVPLPDQFVNATGNCINLTFPQIDEIYGAKLAHIFFTEVRRKVPWRLASYSSEDLKALFGLSYEGCNLLDHSPRLVWDTIGRHIDLMSLTDQKTTIALLTKHTRTFIHGGYYYDGNGNIIRNTATGIVTVEQMAAEEISRHGCWSMAPYLIRLAANLNISGQLITDYYVSRGHATALFPSSNQVLAHGDDPYDSLLGNTPSAVIYDSYDWWAANVLQYKPADPRAFYNSQVHSFALARSYPSHYLMSGYCSQTPSNRIAYLKGIFTSYATDVKLVDLATLIDLTTNSCAYIPIDSPDQ